MSGARTTAVPTLSLARVSDPVRAPAINTVLQQIEVADRGNAKRGQETYFPSLLLLGPDGATYRLSIAITAGVPSLAIAVVPR